MKEITKFTDWSLNESLSIDEMGQKVGDKLSELAHDKDFKDFIKSGNGIETEGNVDLNDEFYFSFEVKIDIQKKN